ncbi:hypothetical protein L3X38_021623 [Prunus dulcis]|uniref:Peptidase S26 domain-containing protein n=1 Tax=Prunus dulcis TaxID=3755 RepID=A0AAD4VWC2_PRUDU|nr:hypothetical protein L3X38_021623 [Prunus dulcis]
MLCTLSMASRYIREFLASEAFKNAGSEVSDVVPRLVKFLCCLQVTKTHLFTVTLSYGPSMLPTLGLAGNLCLAERISTRFEKLGVGDIVLVQSPEVPWKFMTKRLKAMEGQSVTYFVNPKNSDKSETIVVPKGHVWIEGDNIYESNDSRKFGPVPYGLLQGRVFWRIWPPKDFGSLAQNKGKDSVA